MAVAKWLLYIIGIILVLMGILGYLGIPYPALKDPAWHAALKIIIGLVALWGGTKQSRFCQLNSFFWALQKPKLYMVIPWEC